MAFNDGVIADFRAHRGQITEGPFTGRRLLLLTTRGKRSGENRTVPLVYTRDGDRWVIVASKGGAPSHPDWYLNLVAHPTVTVEVDGETFRARANIAKGTERRRLYDAHADAIPSFKDYERKTTREIPAISLERLPD